MKRGSHFLNKKVVASLELSILFVSFFAFSNILYQTGPDASSKDFPENSFNPFSNLFKLLKKPVFPLVSADTTLSGPSTCCERTTNGALCINTDSSNCDSNFKSSPTSCETTSYCRLGTCYDSNEGICMENTPQSVCAGNGGTWDSRELEEVPQCQLGCCIIGDQAAFTSLVRCKKLSTFFGVENNYRTDINSEIECIATAQSQDMGACVYEKEFERICEFTTRADCGAEEVVEGGGSDLIISDEKKFYKDLLCSAEELNTVCGRQASTICYQGRVYWTDSCGNRENVYSTDKDKSWNNGFVSEPDEVCRPNNGDDQSCGNCEYLLGSRCAEWEGVFGLGKPAQSDYFCQKTECTDRYGNKRLNGESWCVLDGSSGDGLDLVGSRHFREICIDGEVEVEPCADFRNEICIDGGIETYTGGFFETAACRVNRWQDCTSQRNSNDCSNTDRRDCKWVDGVEGLEIQWGVTGANQFSNPSSGNSFSNPSNDDDFRGSPLLASPAENGLCIPDNPPGIEFWDAGPKGSACSQISARCQVVYEKGLLDGDWDVVENEVCLTEDWAAKANRACVSLGDCGGYINIEGEYTGDGYVWKRDGRKQRINQNNIQKYTGGFVFEGISPLTVFFTNLFLPFRFVGAQGYGYSNTPTDVDLFEGSLSDRLEVGRGTPPPVGDKELGSSLSEWFDIQKAGGGWDAALSGIQWAAVAYGITYMAANLFGFSDEESNYFATASAVGFGVYKSFSVLQIGNAALWGVGFGAAVLLATYKETKVEVVTFSCRPWQAPRGGDDCEACNDADLPCSEYRCKSLGQSCELVNEGTESEQCVNVNPNDVAPPIIKPNSEKLSSGHAYTNVRTSPPSPGFEIINLNSSDGCLKAFTPLEFGIDTDEPSQCKIDFEHTTSFEDMANFMGTSNLYSYNHTERFSLPGINLLENSSLILQNGNEMTFFIRCSDKNGNENPAEYAVNFCIDPSPDTTPPRVEATSITNGGCVAEDVSSANVEFYTNEPAQCRWGLQDQSYSLMQKEMSCSTEVYQVNAAQLYTCVADLGGIARDETTFYIRCKDQPTAAEEDRNEMAQSFKFSLHGSTALKMKNLRPNETIFGAVNPAPVELYVETFFGCQNGRSICYYSKTGKEDDFIMFFDTNNEDGISTQLQSLPEENHEYTIRCIDSGGNLAEDKISFDLEIDEDSPVVARVYEEDLMLKLVTLRNSECSYSLNDCDFSFEEGTQMPYANTNIHVAEWNKDNTYYIKCRDEFRNEDADCSIIVKPSDKLF